MLLSQGKKQSSRSINNINNDSKINSNRQSTSLNKKKSSMKEIPQKFYQPQSMRFTERYSRQKINSKYIEEIMTQKRIKDNQILNNNIKRKLTLLNQQLHPHNNNNNQTNKHNAQTSNLNNQTNNHNLIKTHQQLTNRQKVYSNTKSYKEFSSQKKNLSNIKLKYRNEQQQKYTREQKLILDSYAREIKQKYKSQIGNPFQLALVQMIQKQQQMVRKRQNDLIFWKNKLHFLQQKYHHLCHHNQA